MTLFESVTVTDTLGECFPLAECSILFAICPETGRAEPRAVVYPDGETVILSHDLTLTGADGESFDLDSVDLNEVTQ